MVGGAIELTPAGVAPADQVYRPFLIASLSMATLLGFVLGIEISVARLLHADNGGRTADFVQAHGQVQLLGFAGLFVIGMSLRLMPRFAGTHVALPPLIPHVLGFFVVGLVERAVVAPWFSGETHSALLLASALSLLAGSACFLVITLRTLTAGARRFEPSSLAFVFGASFLLLASIATAGVVIDGWGDEPAGLPYLADNALLQIELAGFVFSFILGVALRAIPAMVGIERPGRAAGLVAVCLAISVAMLAGALLYLEYGSYSDAVVLLADAAFLALGLTLLALAWLAGVLRQAANRIRPASQANLWLIRSAFVWMLVAALIMAYAGLKGMMAMELPSQFAFDASRHALGLGVVTMLISGMTMMILPEIAAQRQQQNRQRQLAYLLAVLLNGAAFFRVAPALAGTAWSFDQRSLSMAIGGSLAEGAMLIFAAYLLQLFLRARSG